MKLRIIISIVILLFLTLLFYQYMQTSKKTEIQDLADQTLQLTNTAYKAIIDTYSVAAEKHFFNLMNNTQALDILQQFKNATQSEQALLRGQLYRLLYKDYEQLKKFNVRQFHFHTVEGDSLLRFHLPYESGDSLIKIRKSIHLVNTRHKKVIGFEGGRIYPGYRYVFPILRDKEHLGSVEFSISFKAIEKKLKNILPFYAYKLILEKETSYAKVFKQHRVFFHPSGFNNNHYEENLLISGATQETQDDAFIKKLTELAKHTSGFRNIFHQKISFSVPIIDNGNGYVVNFLSIYDVADKIAGHLVSFSKLQNIVTIEKNYNHTILLGFIIAICLAILLIIIILQIEKSRSHQKKLIRLNSSLNIAQSIAHLGSWEHNSVNNRLYWSDEVFTILGLPAQSFKPSFKKFLEFVHPDDRDNVNEVFTDSVKQKTDYYVRHRLIQKDGSIRYVDESGNHTFDSDGNFIKTIGTVHDVTEVISLEKEMLQKLQKFIDIQDSIVILSDGVKLNFANKKFFDFFGYENLEDFFNDYYCICERFIKTNGFFHLDHVLPDEQHWIESLLNLPGRQRIVSMIDKSSVPYAFTVSINKFDNKSYVINFSDISDNMIEKLQLQKQVIQDPLTKAFNRVYFNNSIIHLIELNKKENKHTGIIFFDIDHFKQVNDTYGHKVGDNILKAVVQLVKKHIRENDPIIRWGGEEFIIITSSETPQDIYKQAEHIRTIIEHHKFEDIEKITCSFGVAISKEGEDINNTLKKADIKLYEAKASGRNKVVV